MNSPSMSPRWKLRPILAVLGFTATAALGVIAMLPFTVIRHRLDLLAGDGSAEPYTPLVHSRLQFMSLGMAVLIGGLSVTGFFLGAWFGKRLDEVLRELERNGQVWTRAALKVFREQGTEMLLITGLGMVLRMWWIHQPMRFDEAYTWLQYASWPWYIAISRYEDPNNHLFHTLCVHVVTRFLGDDPWVIRLPALVAGTLMIPAAMLWARQHAGGRVAMLVGTFVACSSPLLEYSTNARGYTLLGLWTCCAGLLAERLMFHRELLSWIIMAIVLALGCWTIPVMVYPILGIVLWWGMALMAPGTRSSVRKSFAWEAAVMLTISGLLTLGLYLPVLVTRGIGGMTGNSIATRFPWSELQVRLPEAYLDTVALLCRDQGPLSLLVLLVGVVLGCCLGDPPGRSLRRLGVVALLLVGLTPILQRVVPFPRIWLFVIPWMAIVTLSGLQTWLQRFQRRRQQGLMALILALTCFLSVSKTISEQTILTSPETGAAPDAEQIASQLGDWLLPGEPVIAIVPLSAPLTYYCRQQAVPESHLNPFYWPKSGLTSALVIVSKDEGHTVAESLEVFQLGDLLDPQTASVIEEFPHAKVFRVVPRK